MEELVCLLEVSSTVHLKRGIKIRQMSRKGPHSIGVTRRDLEWPQVVGELGRARAWRLGRAGEEASGNRVELMAGSQVLSGEWLLLKGLKQRC